MLNKISTSLLTIGLLWFTYSTSAAQTPHHEAPHQQQEQAARYGNNGHQKPGRPHRPHRPSYFVDSNGVYFDGHKVKDASSMNFKDLGDFYAKDTWNVYYQGVKISGASAGSFTVLGDGYAKDTWSVYFNGKKKAPTQTP